MPAPHDRHAVPERGGDDRRDAAQRPRRRTTPRARARRRRRRLDRRDGGDPRARRRACGSSPSPTAGCRDAMNKGIAMAGGDVVGWLNADDVYLPGALRAVGRGVRGAPGRRVGDRALPDHRRRRAGDPQARRRVQELAAAALLASAATSRRTSSPRPRRSSAARRAARSAASTSATVLDGLRRLAAARPPRRPDRARRALACFRMAEGSLSMTGFERQFGEHAPNARRARRGAPGRGGGERQRVARDRRDLRGDAARARGPPNVGAPGSAPRRR